MFQKAEIGPMPLRGRDRMYEQQEKERAYAQACAAEHAAKCETAPQPRDREIPEKVAALFDATDNLSEKLSRFGDRLHGVLVPMPQTPCGELGKANAPELTALGCQLGQLAAKIREMSNALDAWNCQLEL